MLRTRPQAATCTTSSTWVKLTGESNWCVSPEHHWQVAAELKHWWCFRVNSVDATKETARLGRLINHSKNGNCQTKLHDINGVPHLILVASRDIDEGEELLYDYGDRSKASIEAHPWLKNWSAVGNTLLFQTRRWMDSGTVHGPPVGQVTLRSSASADDLWTFIYTSVWNILVVLQHIYFVYFVFPTLLGRWYLMLCVFILFLISP